MMHQIGVARGRECSPREIVMEWGGF